MRRYAEYAGGAMRVCPLASNKNTTPFRKWMPAMVIGILFSALLLAVSPVFAQLPTPDQPDPAAEDLAGDIVDVTVDAAETTTGVFGDILESLTTVPRSDVIRVLFIIGGLILLVGGWRIYDYVIVIAGFIVGAALASAIFVTDSTLLDLVVVLVGGLIGALLSVFLYYVAVFLIGAYLGIVLTSAGAAALNLAPVSSAALLIGGVIGGLILLGLSVEFVLVLAAVVGAQLVALGLGLNATWTLILAAIGILLQIMLTRAFRYQIRRRRRPLFRRYA
jgi:hypothetical protein